MEIKKNDFDLRLISNVSIEFISNEKVNNILNYKPQDIFRCLEVVYNSEVMEVLNSLDPLIPNYNKIPEN